MAKKKNKRLPAFQLGVVNKLETELHVGDLEAIVRVLTRHNRTHPQFQHVLS